MAKKDRQIGITAFATAAALAGAPVPMAMPLRVDTAFPDSPFGGDRDAPSGRLPPVTTGPATGLDPATPGQASSPAPTAIPGAQDPIAEQAGDIVVTARDRRGDPLAPANEQSFAVTQAVDDAVIGPVARAYKKTIPSPIRSGLRNFIANLREPVAALNYLLQLKPGKAGETLGRFAVNSTIGAAGLFDVARKRPFNLPRRRNSLANTLGFYGVKPGPFLFLPLIGPVTVRDLIGNIIDQFAVPVTSVPPLNNPAVTIPLLNIGALDFRAENDGTLTKLKASRDPYGAVRRYYLERRQAEIDALRGRGPPVPLVSGYVLPPVDRSKTPVGAALPAARIPVPPSEPRVIVIPAAPGAAATDAEESPRTDR